MSNYTKSTNFATKDNLTPGDPLKIVRGTEIDTEFNNIATAIATKTDNASAAITGGTINDTTIGATTASTGAFTTLAASGNVTLSGGTANGVAYLNGSKVVTSGSALTFDGTTLATTGKFGITGNGSVPTSSALEIGTNGAGSRLLYNVPTSGEHNFTVNGSVISFQTASAHGWYISGSEQMRLTSTGLGIGTSSPAQKLHVLGSSGAVSRTSVGANANQVFHQIDNSVNTIEIGALASGTAYLSSNGAYPLTFYTNGSERLRLDSSGNLGLGVTPSAYDSSIKAIDIGLATAILNPNSTGQTWFLTNAYYGSSAFRYKASGVEATRYDQASGTHKFYTAPSGTAGDAITFTQAMSLTADGSLLVGTTTEFAKLSVIVPTGANRNLIQAGVTSATDGLTVKWNNATSTIRVNIQNLPTSATGLASGDLWNDGGTLKIA
jgi:hypothetical protein